VVAHFLLYAGTQAAKPLSTVDWLWRSIAPPSSSSKQVAEFNGRRRRHFWFATEIFENFPGVRFFRHSVWQNANHHSIV